MKVKIHMVSSCLVFEQDKLDKISKTTIKKGLKILYFRVHVGITVNFQRVKTFVELGSWKLFTDWYLTTVMSNNNNNKKIKILNDFCLICHCVYIYVYIHSMNYM